MRAFRGSGTVRVRRLVLLGAPPVPVVLEGERDETEPDADEDDDEHPADVLDADAVTLVLDLVALGLVEVPPFSLQVLEKTLVEQQQNSAIGGTL